MWLSAELNDLEKRTQLTVKNNALAKTRAGGNSTVNVSKVLRMVVLYFTSVVNSPARDVVTTRYIYIKLQII